MASPIPSPWTCAPRAPRSISPTSASSSSRAAGCRAPGVRSRRSAPASPPSRLRLGSWIGGDQDGNPYCTAADLQEALRGAEEIARSRHREFALQAVTELTLPLGVDELEPRTRRWLRIHAGERAGRR